MNTDITLADHAKMVDDVAKNASTILLLTHKRPDGDALGSMLAFANAFGATSAVTPYLPEPIPSTLAFLPGGDRIITNPGALEAEYELTVLLDCASWMRTGLANGIVERLERGKIIVIDHHENDARATPRGSRVIVEGKASTTHILALLFQEANVPMTPAVATCLLTGLVTDTGGFIHASTTPEVLTLASMLMRKGANLPKIMKNTIRTKPPNIMKLWGRALARIEQNPHTGVTYSIITKKDLEECHASPEDLSGVANILASIPKSKYALLLTEVEKNRIKGSLRAETDMDTDVAEIAKAFGGGGHKLASGFEIEGRIVKEGGTWKII